MSDAYAEALASLRRAEAFPDGYNRGIDARLTGAQVGRLAKSAAFSAFVRWDRAASGDVDRATVDALRAEACVPAQSVVTSASRAITRATVHGAGDDPVLAQLARDFEALTQERTLLDGQLGSVGRKKELDDAIEKHRLRLEADYPAFFDLVVPRPAEMSELQGGASGRALLRENEAVVFLVPGMQDFRGYDRAVSRDAADH